MQQFAASVRVRAAAMAALLLVFATAGTSYAAQSALPGDPLYPIKIGVNERIAGAFAGGPQGHVRYDTELAARRLEEAETLAANDKLSTSASAQIEANLAQVAADFDTNAAQLATSSDMGAFAVASAQTSLEATLAAHAQILAAIGRAVPQPTTTIMAIAAAIDARISATREAEARIDEVLAASSSGPLASAARQSGRSAEQALGDVRALVPEVRAAFGASSSAAVAARAATVGQVVALGKEHLDRGRYADALDAFQAAIQTAQIAQTAANAAIRLKDILPGLASSTAGATLMEDVGPPVTMISATTSADASTTLGATTTESGSE